MIDYNVARNIVESNKINLQNGLASEREKAGLTQEKLAEKLEYKNGQTVSNWENGVNLPSLETMLILCEMYGCDLDHLTGRIPERTHDIKTVCELTGLSSDAASTLIHTKEKHHWNYGEVDHGLVLSALITHERFDEFCYYVKRLIRSEEIQHYWEKESYNQWDGSDDEDMVVKMGDLVEFNKEALFDMIQYKASSVLSDMLHDLTEVQKKKRSDYRNKKK